MLRNLGRRITAVGLGHYQNAYHHNNLAVVGVRLYHERVVDHYNNPRNVGSFDKNDPTVGTGLVGAPACGDVMKLQIKVDESGKIVDACFKTFGCGSAIASSSVATEWVKGRQMEEVVTIKNTEIAKHLSLPPVKLHCSMLAEDAIKAAVKDYEAKKAKIQGNVEAPRVENAAEAEKVLSNDNPKYGYNAATGKYEDLMAAGIIDPTKVVRCCLEHAASVARTFLTCDVVVVDIKEPEPVVAGNPMDNSGYGY